MIITTATNLAFLHLQDMILLEFFFLLLSTCFPDTHAWREPALFLIYATSVLLVDALS
jgi:hypothetical protein